MSLPRSVLTSCLVCFHLVTFNHPSVNAMVSAKYFVFPMPSSPHRSSKLEKIVLLVLQMKKLRLGGAQCLAQSRLVHGGQSQSPATSLISASLLSSIILASAFCLQGLS